VTEALVGARPLARPSRRRVAADAVERALPPVPRLRGVSHEKSFAFAPALGLLLVLTAEGARATVAASVFAVTMTLMLGVSAVNHRARIAPRWQPLLRRLDHSTVNLFLAGTWTSFALLVLGGTRLIALTTVVCIGAIAASLVTIVWVDVPGWVPAAIALAAGWSAAFLLPDLGDAAGPAALGLILAGGLLYTAGAIMYALRRPNPLPTTVGYHEIFHALVVVGAACHYLAHAFFVLPLAS
jgi:hemolysin III